MNKLYYRWSCIKAGGGSGANDRYVSGGYKKADDALGGGLVMPSAPITSLNTAIAQAMAFLRRLQSAGADGRIEVFGQVFDTNNEADRLLADLPDDHRPRPTNRVRELQASGTPPLEEGREQLYARIDTPEKGLTHVINLSNKDTTSGGAFEFNLDTSEDTDDKTADEVANQT